MAVTEAKKQNALEIAALKAQKAKDLAALNNEYKTKKTELLKSLASIQKDADAMNEKALAAIKAQREKIADNILKISSKHALDFKNKLSALLQDKAWKAKHDAQTAKDLATAKAKYAAAVKALKAQSNTLLNNLKADLKKNQDAELKKKKDIINSIKIPNEKDSLAQWETMWNKLQTSISGQRKEYYHLLDIQKDYSSKLAHLGDLRDRVTKLNAKVHRENDKSFLGVFEQLKNSL